MAAAAKQVAGHFQLLIEIEVDRVHALDHPPCGALQIGILTAQLLERHEGHGRSHLGQAKNNRPYLSQ